LFEPLGISPPDGVLVGVAIAILLFTVLINIVGVQLAARVNNTAVIAEIIGTVLLTVTVIVAFGVYSGDDGGSVARRIRSPHWSVRRPLRRTSSTY
jgi:amino acid transporter